MLTAFSMPPEVNMLKPITCHNGLRGGASGSLLLYEGSTIRKKVKEFLCTSVMCSTSII